MLILWGRNSSANVQKVAWLYRYYTLEIERAPLKNLDDYYERLCARPAYVEHVHISYEFMRVPGAERPERTHSIFQPSGSLIR